MNSLILPNFLVIGAQKAASTSIYYQLKIHDDVFMSETKEINFFDYEYNFRRGLKYYSSYFQGWKGEKVIGEATPEYLHEQNVPERIHKFLPNVKLLVCLRDPIDRAYSAYLMQLAKGSEPPWRCFEEAIYNSSQYLEYGLYHKHLQRYLRYFSLERIHVSLYDDLKNNPQQVYNSICDFLEIDRIDLKEVTISRSNLGGVPKTRLIHNILNLLYRTRNHVRESPAGWLVSNRFVDTTSRKVRNRVASWNRVKGEYPKLSLEVRQRLLPLIQDDNDALARLIKRDLSSWNS